MHKELPHAIGIAIGAIAGAAITAAFAAAITIIKITSRAPAGVAADEPAPATPAGQDHRTAEAGT